MNTFKDFLFEAQFSEDDFQRVLSAFERRLPKLLGAPIYQYGGKGYIDKFSSFSRILYFVKDKAFAIRFKADHVLGIDVWSQYNIDSGPDFFIDIHVLKAAGIIGSIRKLADLIKNPAVGNYEIKELTESIKLDEMAKRITDNAFYNMAIATYGENKTRSMSWDEIKKVADEHDVLIPAYVRGQKVGRGAWDLEPKEKETASAVNAEVASSPKPVKRDGSKDILFIKVTAQDPTTKKFISASDSSAAQEMYAKISGGLEQPTTKELRDPETLYGHMAQLVDMACKGTLKSLLIFGGPGTGKCFFGMTPINIVTKEELKNIKA